MELRFLEFARYASQTQENLIDIGGIVNRVMVKRPDGVGADALTMVPVPPLFLVCILEASIGDGLSHPAALRVVDDNGETRVELDLGTWDLSLNSDGRPMRLQALLNVGGVQLPGPGEYSFELRLSGLRVGAAMLYVDDTTGES